MNRLTRNRLTDEMFDGYIDWREACRAVNDAYRSWSGATGIRGSITFGRYLAALDREQRAAEVYADRVHRVEHLGAIPSGGAGEPPGAGRVRSW